MFVVPDKLWSIQIAAPIGEVHSVDLGSGLAQMRWIPIQGGERVTIQHPPTLDEAAAVENTRIGLLLQLLPTQVERAIAGKKRLHGRMHNVISLPSIAPIRAYDLYFDPRDCHLRRVVVRQRLDDGKEVTTEIMEYGNYRVVDGISLPFSFKLIHPAKYSARMSYALNVDYDPSIFREPLRPAYGGWRADPKAIDSGSRRK